MAKKNWLENLWGKAFAFFLLELGLAAVLTALGLGVLSAISVLSLNTATISLAFVIGLIVSVVVLVGVFMWLAKENHWLRSLLYILAGGIVAMILSVIFGIVAGATTFLGILLGLIAGYFGATAAFWLADKKTLDKWVK